MLFNYYIGFTVKIEETKLLHSIVKDNGACQDGSLYLFKELILNYSKIKTNNNRITRTFSDEFCKQRTQISGQITMFTCKKIAINYEL